MPMVDFPKLGQKPIQAAELLALPRTNELFAQVFAASRLGAGHQATSAAWLSENFFAPTSNKVGQAWLGGNNSLASDADWQAPVEKLRQELESYGQPAEDILLEPEKRAELAELLAGLGLDESQVEKTIDEATLADQRISLKNVLESLESYRRQNAGRDSLVLPAGLAPQFLVLLKKMGLDDAKLKRLSEILGHQEIPLNRLASLLNDLGQAGLALLPDDLPALANILSRAGLSWQKIAALMEKYQDPQGRLTMPGLAALLAEAAKQGDQGQSLANSAQLKVLVARLMEGAKVSESRPETNQARSQELSLQLSQLKGQARVQTQIHRPELGLLDQAADQPRAAAAKTSWPASAANKPSGQKSEKAEGDLSLLRATLFSAGLSSKNQPSAGLKPPVLETAKEAGAALSRSQASFQAGFQGGEQNLGKKAAPLIVRSPEIQVFLTSTKPTANSLAQQIGQSQGATPARMQPSTMLEQLAGRILIMVKAGQQSVRLQLNPPELGQVRIDLTVDGRVVRATVVAENQQVQQALGAQSSELRQSLAEQGFNLEHFEVWVKEQGGESTFGQFANQGQSQEEAAAGPVVPGPEADEDLAQTLTWLAGSRAGRVHIIA